MARRQFNKDVNILNNTSFLDAMSNTVGALAFLLLLVVLVTVALKLNYFDLKINTENLPDAVVGEEYSIVLSGIGGNEPYQWELVSGILPKGLKFSNTTELIKDHYGNTFERTQGKIYGTPLTQTKDAVKLVFKLDDTPVVQDESNKESIDKPADEETFYLNVLPAKFQPGSLEIVTKSLPVLFVDKFYEIPIAMKGGYPPFKWSCNFIGDIPPGISFDNVQGILSGTPSKDGEWKLTITVEDSRGKKAELNNDLKLKSVIQAEGKEEIIKKLLEEFKLKITTVSIPDASINQSYNLTLAATGGISPYKWEISKDISQFGLQFDVEKGRITGTPTKLVKDFKFAITVKNEEDTDSKELSISINPAPRAPEKLTLF